jgi:hypothetical protein
MGPTIEIPNTDLALETLDWLDEFAGEFPDEVDQVKRVIVQSLMLARSRQPTTGEKPQPINGKPMPKGECPWCFEPLGELRSEFNGGIGHPECTRFAYEALAGDEAMPWPIAEPSSYRVGGFGDFLERLGLEAARLGINPHKLATAVMRARNDAR